jgi:hypothetical protein
MMGDKVDQDFGRKEGKKSESATARAPVDIAAVAASFGVDDGVATTINGGASGDDGGGGNGPLSSV